MTQVAQASWPVAVGLRPAEFHEKSAGTLAARGTGLRPATPASKPAPRFFDPPVLSWARHDMTIRLNPEQEEAIGLPIQAGQIATAGDVVDVGIEAIRQRLQSQGGSGRDSIYDVRGL